MVTTGSYGSGRIDSGWARRRYEPIAVTAGGHRHLSQLEGLTFCPRTMPPYAVRNCDVLPVVCHAARSYHAWCNVAKGDIIREYFHWPGNMSRPFQRQWLLLRTKAFVTRRFDAVCPMALRWSYGDFVDYASRNWLSKSIAQKTGMSQILKCILDQVKLRATSLIRLLLMRKGLFKIGEIGGFSQRRFVNGQMGLLSLQRSTKLVATRIVGSTCNGQLELIPKPFEPTDR